MSADGKDSKSVLDLASTILQSGCYWVVYLLSGRRSLRVEKQGFFPFP